MNKIEGVRGFLTFCLIVAAFVFLFITVKFIISQRTLRDNSKAEQENILPEDINLSLTGFQKALSSYDVSYDLNKDKVINMYDYYLLVPLLNQASNNK